MASARQERARLIDVMRAEGRTWPQIAEEVRVRYQVNARVAMRWAHGWTQRQAAEKWCSMWPDDIKTDQNISSWELWPHSGHEPALHTLGRLAQVYECDVADLIVDVGRYGHLDQANAAPVIRSTPELSTLTAAIEPHKGGNDKDVDRRDFTRAAALTALGLADPLRALGGLSTLTQAVIGAKHVELVHAALEHSGKRDAAHGSTSLRPAVAVLRHQVENWLSGHYSLDRGTGDELQAALGELYAWSGWLALDANDRSGAAHHVKDALVHAHVADDRRLEVRSLALLSLITRPLQPRQALHCAQAAQRAAQGWATSRVSALLHLRIAGAHATLGEAGAFSRETAKAMQQLDQGPQPDDPQFVHFMTPMELTGLRGLSLLALAQPDRAATELRSITETPDPTYRRNLAYYTTRLAQAEAANHDITAAATTGLAALQLAADLESARTRSHLTELRTTLQPHSRRTPAVRDFIEQHDQETPQP